MAFPVIHCNISKGMSLMSIDVYRAFSSVLSSTYDVPIHVFLWSLHTDMLHWPSETCLVLESLTV